MHYCQYVRFSVLEPRAERDDGEIERSIAGWIPSQKRQHTGHRIAPARLHTSVLYTSFFVLYFSLSRDATRIIFTSNFHTHWILVPFQSYIQKTTNKATFSQFDK
jgi:hypothetical protein